MILFLIFILIEFKIFIVVVRLLAHLLFIIVLLLLCSWVKVEVFYLIFVELEANVLFEWPSADIEADAPKATYQRQEYVQRLRLHTSFVLKLRLHQFKRHQVSVDVRHSIVCDVPALFNLSLQGQKVQLVCTVNVEFTC